MSALVPDHVPTYAVPDPHLAPVTAGKKLPGTSARFAPGGQGVVWG
jgi:hypothetical protein